MKMNLRLDNVFHNISKALPVVNPEF